jgi:hypothetical protein
MKMGNAKSLDIAARLGSESNRRLARQRLSEFANSLSKARASGARTAEEVAAKFNGLGHRTARSLPWTGANISSYLGKLKISSAASSASSIGAGSKPQSIADVNRQLTPDGVERVRKAMILKAAVGAEFSFRLRAPSIPGCVSLVSDAEERARDGL